MRKSLLPTMLCISSLVLGFLLTAPQVRAWGNGGYSADPDAPDYGIHDWIADKALSFQIADITFLLTTFHADYLIGTEAPDNGEYIGDSYNHHVYYTATNELQADIGALRAREMYRSALTSLRASDYEHAAYYAGAMAHYISDVGAYGHTMGSSTDWGTSPHHSEYEEHVGTMLGTLTSPTLEPISWRDAYNATLTLARETTFGSGAIRPNIWMEANYNWDDAAFRASCLDSLNESVRAVASAIGQLLSEAGLSTIPEFWSPVMVLACCMVMLTITMRIKNRTR
jgi:hypothetical protein